MQYIYIFIYNDIFLYFPVCFKTFILSFIRQMENYYQMNLSLLIVSDIRTKCNLREFSFIS